MSVAVAVCKHGRVAIGADTQTNFGDQRLTPANFGPSKLHRVGTAWVAITGWELYENILADYLARRAAPRLDTARHVFAFFLRFWRDLHDRYSFVNDQAHTDDPTPFADLDAAFLVATPKGIFNVAGNMSVTAPQQYAAAGSGMDYALGTLFALYDDDRLGPEDLVRRACEAAIAFNIYCGGQVEVRTVTPPVKPPAAKVGKRRR